jgi:predicted acetyltransferase
MTDARPPWPVRPLTDDDWDGFQAVDSHAFGMTMPPELVDSERELLRGARSIGAYDGPTLAGIAAAYAYQLSTPGSTLPAAAVTWVGVLPTHRRRGVLTALMTHQLHAVHEQGEEPLAILWASEPQIYGRYGYGMATRSVSLTVPRDPRALHGAAPADPALRLHLTDPADWKRVAGVYESVAAQRPGVPLRDEPWWRRAVRDVPALRGGSSELRCVVAEDDTGPRGYALYATKQSFDEDFGSGAVTVSEVMAADAAALATVYRYLFDLDLMGRTTLWNVPVDDPLLHWLQNPRRAKPSLGDSLYVRLVDLPRALEGRTYATAVDLVLEVTDALCPWNAGRWRLTAGPGGAACRRTEDAADLVLDVRELGAAFLGGTALAELALAGRVVESTPGRLAAASAAFQHAPAPWCPRVF